MATIRVDSQDFRNFITWLIDKAIIDDCWEQISRVYEKPWHCMDDYLKFQEETYEPEEPDIDEAQEWEDFDPTITMEAMYGGDDGFFD